ncbi:hypothetical protein WR25_20341 [Diploscapter pachys]|uniref:G-protein coupled receptors family 1 profile domain-containing protein n=1 Tax=Diploscapter pachys TaxID=2018661 RepID=A0A2A2JNW8_9BILA|nr:hypothetical protein WR25_20341 [Diploscapter pachys]
MSASESVMDFVNDTHMRHLMNETARQQKCDYTMYQRPIEPIAYYVYLFILPVVNLIGVMIEVVCFIVFTKKQMRFIAVKYPLHMKIWCTPTRAFRILVGITIFSTIYRFPTFFELTHNHCGAAVDSQLQMNQNYRFYYMCISFAIFNVLLPWTIMLILNIYVVREVRRAYHIRQVMQQVIQTNKANEEKEKRHCTIMATVMVCSFLFFNILSAINTVDEQFGVVIPREFDPLGNLLTCVNSAFNVIIYAFFSSRFRQTFMTILCGENKTKNIQVRVFMSGAFSLFVEMLVERQEDKEFCSQRSCNSNNRGVSKAREKVHDRINSNSNKNKNKNNYRNQSNYGNNRNTDSSRNRSKDKKKEQPGPNIGHSVISTHKTSDKGNHMAYALEPKSDIKKRIAMKVGKKVAKFLGKKLFGSKKQKKVPTERIYPIRPVSVGIPEMIRPNQALVFNYTNKFREDVFSQNSTYLAYNLTSNVYTIKQTAPNFSYGQHLYYFGPTYKLYNQEVKDTKMCQFKFDRSDEVSIETQEKLEMLRFILFLAIAQLISATTDNKDIGCGYSVNSTVHCDSDRLEVTNESCDKCCEGFAMSKGLKVNEAYGFREAAYPTKCICCVNKQC